MRDDLDSPGAILFRRFASKALNLPGPAGILGAVGVGPPDVYTKPFDPDDPVNTPNGLNTDSPGVRAALADAVKELRDLGIPLDAAPARLAVRAARRRADPDPRRPGRPRGLQRDQRAVRGRQGLSPTSRSGSSFVMAAHLTGGCPESRAILTYSQSANPALALLRRPDPALLAEALARPAVLREQPAARAAPGDGVRLHRTRAASAGRASGAAGRLRVPSAARVPGVPVRVVVLRAGRGGAPAPGGADQGARAARRAAAAAARACTSPASRPRPARAGTDTRELPFRVRGGRVVRLRPLLAARALRAAAQRRAWAARCWAAAACCGVQLGRRARVRVARAARAAGGAPPHAARARRASSGCGWARRPAARHATACAWWPVPASAAPRPRRTRAPAARSASADRARSASASMPRRSSTARPVRAGVELDRGHQAAHQEQTAAARRSPAARASRPGRARRSPHRRRPVRPRARACPRRSCSRAPSRSRTPRCRRPGSRSARPRLAPSSSSQRRSRRLMLASAAGSAGRTRRSGSGATGNGADGKRASRRRLCRSLDPAPASSLSQSASGSSWQSFSARRIRSSPTSIDSPRSSTRPSVKSTMLRARLQAQDGLLVAAPGRRRAGPSRGRPGMTASAAGSRSRSGGRCPALASASGSGPARSRGRRAWPSRRARGPPGGRAARGSQPAHAPRARRPAGRCAGSPSPTPPSGPGRPRRPSPGRCARPPAGSRRTSRRRPARPAGSGRRARCRVSAAGGSGSRLRWSVSATLSSRS